ncbi:YmfQ family protein [Enterobacter sp.]|uniref:YmfQ family protein n=1 Tax=Enterobacter sp. TaxID=42895 RepID=UPI00296E5BE2|nr:putative phage tail protein [Enterobacter sp.]
MDLTRQYEQMLGALLPRGPAWDKDDPLLTGLAPSLQRAHARGDALMNEVDARTVTELIDRYETLAGLPDSCVPPGTQTLAERRQRLDAKLNLPGGINEAFYYDLLAALGYPEATITRYGKSQFRCTSRCTDSLFSDEWRYFWQVNIPASAQISSMTCTDYCTASLRSWGDTVLECVVMKLAPSHTYVTFLYQE